MKNEETNQTKLSSSAEVKDCCVCGEPIKDSAKKCTQCGSYQDWTRHLLRWSTLLVALLGIAPLWGVANSLHKIAFSQKTANIEAALTSCGREQITVAFSNSGQLDGIVTDVNFSLLENGKRTKTFEVRAQNVLSDIVVSPKTPPVLTTYKAFSGNTETIFISKPNSHKSCFFVMDLNWIDFKGSTKNITRQCTCP
jgi:hypothetical protein